MEMKAHQPSNVSGLTAEETFLQYSEKLEQVRDVMVKVEPGSLEGLVLVDTIQRLGIGHLFTDEIEAILYHHYLATKRIFIDNDCRDLYMASLSFRLLRQHGYHLHADDFFMVFKGKDGKFLFSNTKSVLALYEASHLSMEGETILHEAAKFSFHHLNDRLRCLEDEQMSTMVKNCLLFPRHKTLSWFKPENVLQSLNGENRWENLLQEIADFELAIAESMHKREILQVVKWWNGLGLSKEKNLSLRDQPQKWHMWSMAVLLGPTWSKHRILLTKPISLVYAVDDIFDLHGTLHELTLFTEAVSRWDISATEELPSYMKTCFMAINDIVNEISLMNPQEHGMDPIEFLRKEWGNLFKAFLTEAKWFTRGELPKAEEYLKNGMISSGVPMVLSHLFFLVGNSLSKETHDLLNDPHGLTHSVAKMLRLLDDLGTAKDEEQEGYDGSYVEYYMKEEHIDSIEAAHEHVMGLVSDIWENLNKHGLSSTSPFSASFREACLNAARMVPAMYSYDQNHRLPLLEGHVKSMFQDETFSKSILG